MKDTPLAAKSECIVLRVIVLHSEASTASPTNLCAKLLHTKGTLRLLEENGFIRWYLVFLGHTLIPSRVHIGVEICECFDALNVALVRSNENRASTCKEDEKEKWSKE